MANSKKNRTKGKSSKKKSRKEVEKKLGAALEQFKIALGEKKFNRRIQKAGKFFAQGLDKVLDNNNKASGDKKKNKKGSKDLNSSPLAQSTTTENSAPAFNKNVS
jgi:hypothetical protein